ncbi:MAG: 2-oxo acid dehydrogenase subunit E2 [Clostridia bacterium]|nr:2-oxo acid dehydrogenase subunit E2 [Clostridia bacterium]
MMTINKRRRFGDRVDAVQITDLDSMHAIMPGVAPNRADNEAFIQLTLDVGPLTEWLAEKNAKNPQYRYTYFHAVLAAIGRVFEMRPEMNRFIKGCRYYQRNDIRFAFVAKREFSDHASEGVALINYEPKSEKSSIDEMHDKVTKFVHAVRTEKKSDGTTDIMDFLTKMPKRMLYRVMRLLNWLDDRGIMPKSITMEDPYAASVFISNVGSLGLQAGYHHLANWGTNSVFVLMGQKREENTINRDGSVTTREVIDVGITLDERIADGYYYAKTVRIVKHLIEHPELLDTPCNKELTLDV